MLCVLHTHLTSFDPHNHPVNSPYSEMSPCRSNGTKVPTVTETKVARSVLRAGPSQQSQRLLPTHWKSTLGINHLSTQKTLRTKYVPSFPLCGLKFYPWPMLTALRALLGSGNRTREMTHLYSFTLCNTKESKGLLFEVLFSDPGSN